MRRCLLQAVEISPVHLHGCLEVTGASFDNRPALRYCTLPPGEPPRAWQVRAGAQYEAVARWNADVPQAFIVGNCTMVMNCVSLNVDVPNAGFG